MEGPLYILMHFVEKSSTVLGQQTMGGHNRKVFIMHEWVQYFDYSFPMFPDKQKRTAFMHAVMSGHAHVVSFFLNMGSNPNHADASGNTCVHYAAGYGWYHVLKLLLQARANPNASNDWKVIHDTICPQN